MPYKSEAQRRFFNSPAGKAKIGAKEVEHWNKTSKGKELPEKAIDKAIRCCDEELKVKPYRDHYALFLGNEKLEEGTYREMEEDKKDYYFVVNYLPTGLVENEGRKKIEVIAANKKEALKKAKAIIGNKPKDLQVRNKW